MSTNIPAVVPAIPSPVQTLDSLQQSVLAIKQNVETLNGTRGASRPNLSASSAGRAVSAALNAVKRANMPP